MKSFALNALMTLSLLILPWMATYALACPEGMVKDVKKEVEKIEDGVIIKITSDNPEIVRRIQEKAGEHVSKGHCKQEGSKHHHHEKGEHS